jgi:hypothetical protein
MNKRLGFTALVVVVVCGVAALIAGAAGAAKTETLDLLDVAAPIDTFVDEAPAGFSTGDAEVFRDSLVWAHDRRPAGKAEGRCTLIEVSTRQSSARSSRGLKAGR